LAFTSIIKDTIGKTPEINPSSEYGENVSRGFVISFSKGDFWKVEG